MDAPRLDDLIELVRSRASDDPLAQLQEAAGLKQEVDELTDALLGHFVDQARRSGATWSQIGDALGVSKQAAQQRHTSTESTARRLLARLAPKLASGGFRRFTPRARSVVVAAQEAAVGLGAGEIGAEHVLLGLYAEPLGIAAVVLEELGATQAAISRAVLDRSPDHPEPPRGHVPFSAGAKQTLEHALGAALDLGHNYIGTEHILLGLLALDAEEPAAEILAAAGVTEPAAKALIVEHLTGR